MVITTNPIFLRDMFTPSSDSFLRKSIWPQAGISLDVGAASGQLPTGCWLSKYLSIDEQLRGSVQALQEHHFVGFFRDSVGHGGPDASPRRTQPQAGGEGPQLWNRVLHQSKHVVGPCRKGQSEALRERISCSNLEKSVNGMKRKLYRNHQTSFLVGLLHF